MNPINPFPSAFSGPSSIGEARPAASRSAPGNDNSASSQEWFKQSSTQGTAIAPQNSYLPGTPIEKICQDLCSHLF
jgi:hypothetical protein